MRESLKPNALTVVDNPYVTLWCHPDKGIIHHQIHQFISGDTFRDFLLAGTEVLIKYKATKWLSDDRASAVLRPEDVEWSHHHWFPKTALAGWKYWAIVRPAKAVGQVTMKGLADEYGKYGILSSSFADPDEAMRWLVKQ